MTRSLESVNYPGWFVRHADLLCRIDQVTSGSTALTKSEATFTVISGLASPSCYSFQATNGLFLRHRDWRLHLEANTGIPTFRADATFCPADGSVAGSGSLVPFNFPDRRLRHRNFELWVDAYEDTARFRVGSSFRLTAPWTSKASKGSGIPACTQIRTSPSSTAATTCTSAAARPPATRESTHLGVAVSDSPTGPFRDALSTPLIRAGAYPGQAIDPMVFTDNNGQSYLYWIDGAAHVVPRNADMISFYPGVVRTITTTGFREGSFVLKRNGTYYFMRSENGTRDENYQAGYATGPSPVEPWTKQGVVLQKRLELGIKCAGHHTVVR